MHGRNKIKSLSGVFSELILTYKWWDTILKQYLRLCLSLLSFLFFGVPWLIIGFLWTKTHRFTILGVPITINHDIHVISLEQVEFRAKKGFMSTGSRGSKVLINVLSFLALMHIHILSEQPNPRAFLTQSILDSTVRRDVTERGPPSLSQTSRGQRGKRERPGIRLFSEHSNRTVWKQSKENYCVVLSQIYFTTIL